jgi:FtsZ-binding cell division protein ZapB
VAYYVGKNFNQKTAADITKLEVSIETDYVRLLQDKCQEERNYMHALRRQIQYAYSARLRDEYKRQLENFQAPWCDRLQQMVGVAG